jgi:hypothetical protein
LIALGNSGLQRLGTRGTIGISMANSEVAPLWLAEGHMEGVTGQRTTVFGEV